MKHNKYLVFTALAIIALCILSGCEKKSNHKNRIGYSIAGGKEFSVSAKEITPWVDCVDTFFSVQDGVCLRDEFIAVVELHDRVMNKRYYSIIKANEDLSKFDTIPLETEDIFGKDGTLEKCIFITENGKIYFASRIFDEEGTEQAIHIIGWNADGEKLWSTDLPEEHIGEKVYGICALEDGSVNVMLGGKDATFELSIDNGGNVIEERIVSDEANTIFSNSIKTWNRGEGNIRVLYSVDKDETEQYLTDYNMRSGSFTKKYELPFLVNNSDCSSLYAGSESTLIYSGDDDIFLYQYGDRQETVSMNYLDSGVNVTYVDSIIEKDSRHYWVSYKEDNSTLKIGFFSEKDSEDIVEKERITIGGVQIDSIFRRYINEYNQSNEKYRLVVKEYSYDENSHSYLQLNKDIASGNLPDILFVKDLPIQSLIEKGLIADIQTFIEQDEELSLKEFMENVFKAYSVDGRLMYVVPSFCVRTVVGKKAVVGEKEDWTLNKMDTLFSDMGENTQLMPEITRNKFMEEAIQFIGNHFIDEKSGKCSFNSDEFVCLLKIAKKLPVEFDRMGYYDTPDYWEGYEAQFRENMTLCDDRCIRNLSESLVYDLNGMFGEEYSFIGFPGKEKNQGTGAFLEGFNPMVISANSIVLDGAWEFVRYFLTDEYQNLLEDELPVNKLIFYEKAQKLTGPFYYKNGNGETVEGVRELFYHGEEIPVPAMSQEQVEQLITCIEDAKEIPSVADQGVLQIIEEEAEAYYLEQKTAEDVAKIIQNRIELYLSE